ncbi:zinc finger protein 862-like [Nematostella vectensis]|uniref:zinc finger protein 862-like n=1 Tax=Nematostella vectensis TaxID=45351 RepID=UPI0020770FA8|nr:zinc finger protein 862-like [Nematostella vectensis]
MDEKLSLSTATDVNWLIYVEGQGMFCLLCRKHGTSNPQNKSKKYSLDPAVRFKRAALEDHAQSQQHKAAVEAELLSRVSSFEVAIKEIQSSKDEVYYKTFLAMYWLAKEEMPNKKFTSLLSVLEQLGLDNIKYFQHRSAGSVREMFLLIGSVLKEQLTTNLSLANCFGILSDKVCDVSNIEQLVTFVKYVDPNSGKAHTTFLAASDLLESSTTGSPDAKSITEAIISQVTDAGLKMENVSSFSSDGASVMTGRRSGVATRLKADNKAMLNIHCICHRLALACGDANDTVDYIKQVERILIQLWSFFDNSAKKTAAYAKSVLEVKKINVSAKGKKQIGKRFKKACRTRWLSTEKAIEGVFEDYEALLQTLRFFKESNDATATGLLKQTSKLKFIGTVYLLHEVLPILGHLSKAFQEGEVCFASIAPAIDYTMDQLDDVAKNQTHLARMTEDLIEGGRLSRCDLPDFTPEKKSMLQSLTRQYVQALKDNIVNRFSGNLEVLTAFKIFDPCAVPEKTDPGFKEYGKKEAIVLADFFYNGSNDQAEKKDELLAEWTKIKYNILSLKSEVPQDVRRPSKKLTNRKTPTEWLLEHMMAMKATYQHMCPCLLQIVEICLSLPVSNAWPERGASAIKRLKTRLRSSMKNDMLQALMHVTINGPSTSECKPIIEEVTRQWLAKPRRKLANPPSKDHQLHKPTTTDAGTQVDPIPMDITDIEHVWETARALEADVVALEEEMEATAALLKLPPDDLFGDYSDSDFEYSDSECV